MSGIVVSGTITNTGTATMHCVPSSFLLVDASGNATMPAAEWCDVPSIAPSHSAGFNAAFPAASGRLQLRYVHPDGSYEVHDLPLPPA